ncbi:52 kDa repressor of the inhibitor of the protein kinase-like isoform X2 [Anneissia japonica]|uniref:52 kDa repressor of the inhibitor of the protein kinase-like isoform X2 n=1 Tax=Anneissia japonica TaxID=1529436 RepID=UPI0014258A51|nr:52 kDa repressor of the inhibitor of the protein kinase-like isoform X2 [Anneissia japonica]
MEINYCVVGGCCNKPTKKQTVNDLSFFRFPKESNLRQKWIRFVQLTRPKFTSPGNDRICEEHFDKDCINQTWIMHKQFGMHYRDKLKKDSFPTIIKQKKVTRTRTYSVKRQERQLVETLLKESEATPEEKEIEATQGGSKSAISSITEDDVSSHLDLCHPDQSHLNLSCPTSVVMDYQTKNMQQIKFVPISGLSDDADMPVDVDYVIAKPSATHIVRS